MVEIVTLDGGRASLGASEIASLRNSLRGGLILAGDATYENARRVWNGNVDRRPAVIARCANTADVKRAVSFASSNGLLVSVRGGGHSAPGYGTNDGGMVIDLSPMKAIQVDPAGHSARAEGGVLWREFDEATQVHGLATTGGTVSSTGISGPDPGRRPGLAHGQARRLSGQPDLGGNRYRRRRAPRCQRDTHPDLFWALRGGGGNFGVVTSLEYRMHPVGQVLGGMVLHTLDRAAEMLRFYRDFCATLPDEAEAYAGLLTSPEGVPMAAMVLGYNGPIEEGERILAPARRFGPPAADMVAPMPYCTRQTMLDTHGAEHGLHRYWRSAFTEQIVRRLDRSDGGWRRPVQFAHECAVPVPCAWCHHPRASRRNGVRGSADAVGLRCHRAMGGRLRKRRAHRLGA